MNFNKHLHLDGQHAFLGASKYHWVNYDEAKVADLYSKWQASQKGTELHEFAARCIKLGQKLPKSQKTLNMYVNDAIGFKMITEQTLYYSENCFGTADSIIFRNNLLRIHDLKTGVMPAHIEQLEIYAALFCLEYKVKPSEIDIELRLYQSNDILVHNPTTEDIRPVLQP
ncbi:hypothetical protein FACS189490_10540 [Clostridia bacterium]|nr:hypothetical protein FACS189490_10540 [Clostridia bacterium]